MALDFYVIPPNAHLELMNEGNRYFCLAQIYYSNETYRNFFKQKVKEGKWVTLDNGAGDHALITEDILFECMKDLMPSEVIPPDFLFDKDKTIEGLCSFINRMAKEDLTDKVEIFGCPQGSNFEEWVECYTFMLNHPAVKTIGMSKLALPYAVFRTKDDSNIKEARNLVYSYLFNKGLLKKPLHFLGMGDPTEFEHYTKGFARSTDSCNTVWSAMNNICFDKGDFTRIKTPHDYFDRTIAESEQEQALKNIDFLRDIVSKIK